MLVENNPIQCVIQYFSQGPHLSHKDSIYTPSNELTWEEGLCLRNIYSKQCHHYLRKDGTCNYLGGKASFIEMDFEKSYD